MVFECNDRCNQENLIAQLAGGVRALSAPVDNLDSNWAYMVMTALAWNLKAWWALWLPEEAAAGGKKHRREKQTRAADGVQDVRQCLHQDSLPDRSRGPAVDLSRAELQSAPAGVLPLVRCVALLTSRP